MEVTSDALHEDSNSCPVNAMLLLIMELVWEVFPFALYSLFLSSLDSLFGQQFRNFKMWKKKLQEFFEFKILESFEHSI